MDWHCQDRPVYEDNNALVISCHSLGHDDLAFTTKCIASLGHFHYGPASIANYFGSLGPNGAASIVTCVGSTGLKTDPASIVTYVGSTGLKTGSASIVTYVGSTRHRTSPACIAVYIGSTGHTSGPASIVTYAGSTGELSRLTFVAISLSDAESAASFVRIGGNDSCRFSLLSKKKIAITVLSSWPFASERDDRIIKQNNSSHVTPSHPSFGYRVVREIRSAHNYMHQSVTTVYKYLVHSCKYSI